MCWKRRKQNQTLSVWIPYPAKISFTNEGKRKTFSEKLQRGEFTISKPAPQEILTEVLQAEGKW